MWADKVNYIFCNIMLHFCRKFKNFSYIDIIINNYINGNSYNFADINVLTHKQII